MYFGYLLALPKNEWLKKNQLLLGKTIEIEESAQSAILFILKLL